MKKRTETLVVMVAAAVGLVGLAGCDEASARPEEPEGEVMEVTAVGLELEGPGEVGTGWTTIRLDNRSGMIHFAVLQRLPEGIGVEDHQSEVAPVFQEGMNLLNAGEAEAALAEFGRLPEWYQRVVFLGGPGLIAAGETGQTTVYLEPGTYLLECYVKTGGVFHSYDPDPALMGMVHEFTVTAEPGDGREPTADLAVTISSEGGITVEGEPAVGRQTVAVQYADQTAHEHFLGHDVHLVELPAGADAAEVAAWMDWTQPHGLESPAPATFLGGIHEMPAGETGYFTAELEPGRYAWVAEVPDPAAKGMLKTFTVR